jgi:hypothetical protein
MTAGGMLKTAGQVAGIAGQVLNQRQTIRDLKAAQENLSQIQGDGATSTLTPEMKSAMEMALKNYTQAKQSSQFGFTPEQSAAYKAAIERGQTGQITAASEAGGGQMASYVGAVASANKADNLLDMMSKDAALRLQKEQFAASQLNPVMSMSNATQGVMENDTNRYTNLLREAGMAVSNLRMQKADNREKIFNTAGTALYNKGQAHDEKMAQFGKVFMNMAAPGLGNLMGGGKSNTDISQFWK